MFIRKHTHGGYRGTEQVSGRGDYLALFAWNEFKAMDEVRIACSDCCMLTIARADAMARWQTPEGTQADREAYNWPQRCEKHDRISEPAPEKYPNGRPKLWALIRSCSLHQCGHFMMGTIRVGGVSITVSGSIGHDGLPLDLQAVPADYRDRLIEVPEDVATAYWTDDTGHNDVGAVRPTLQSWALALPQK